MGTDGSPKKEEGLDLMCFIKSAQAVIITKVDRIRKSQNSIWAKWMRKRYMRSKLLTEIGKLPNNDSALWVEILDTKPKIEKIISVVKATI